MSQSVADIACCGMQHCLVKISGAPICISGALCRQGYHNALRQNCATQRQMHCTADCMSTRDRRIANHTMRQVRLAGAHRQRATQGTFIGPGTRSREGAARDAHQASM
eukprot:771085-Prymnesium_polylepis.2